MEPKDCRVGLLRDATLLVGGGGKVLELNEEDEIGLAPRRFEELWEYRGDAGSDCVADDVMGVCSCTGAGGGAKAGLCCPAACMKVNAKHNEEIDRHTRSH